MKSLIIYASVIFICICGQLFSQQGSIKINSLEGSAIKGDAGKLFILHIGIGSPDQVIGLTGLSFNLKWNSTDYIEALNSSRGSFFGNDQLFLYRNYPERLEAGVTSTTGPYSGSGTAVVCTMKVKQKVSGTVNITFDLTDISAIDAQGKSVQLTPFNNQFEIKLCDELPLELLSPNGGEFLKVETTKEITWSSKGIDSIRIEYSTNNGKDWQIIAGSIPAATGKYLWTVPDRPSEECLVKISSRSDAGQADISSRPFVIYPSRQVFGPYLPDEYTLALLHFDGDLKNRSALTSNADANGGGVAFSNESPLGSGQSVSINNKDYCGSGVSIPHASCLDLQGDFTIEFWAKIRSAGTGCVTWSALISKPADNSSQAPCYQLGLWDSGIQAFGQIFNGSIGPRVFSNNGSFSMGSWYHFALIRDTKNNKFRLLIHDSNRNLVDQTEAPNMPSNLFPMRSLKDLLIGSPFDGYIDELRISSTVRDFSPAALSLISPNGYELLYPFRTHRIQWSSQNVGKVKLEFSANGGNTWSLIAAGVDASASFYNWTVPNVISDSCRVRITDLSDPGVCEQSLYNFSIKKPSVHLTAPGEGERWYCGSKRNITWTSQGVSFISIRYSSDDGASWTLIDTCDASKSPYSWTVPNINSRKCRFQISSTSDVTVSDKSTKAFRIMTLPIITVKSPDGGENIKGGTYEYISWVTENVDSIKIEYSINDGSNWITLQEKYPADSLRYRWMVPNTPSEKCLIRLNDAADLSIFDVSSRSFIINGLSSAENISSGIPREFGLSQNYPNPFNPATAIKFQLPENAFVKIIVYDQLGREVATLVNEEKPAGYHIIYWNGKGYEGSVLSSGIYLYKLTAGNYIKTYKMNFLK